MSHEIRAPMNVILGIANRMGKSILVNDQRFYLNTINSSAENLLTIINAILDLSKISFGKLSVERSAFLPKK